MVIQIRKQEPQFTLLQKLTLLLLIFVGMDFMGQYKTFAMVACIAFLIIKVRFVINGDFLWLLLFATSWAIFSPTGNGAITYLMSPFMFPLAYCVGLNFLSTDDQELAEKNLRSAMLVVSTGPFIHFLLNFLVNLGSNTDRNAIDVWSGEAMAATGQASLALMMLSLSIVMLFTNARGRIKVLNIVVVIAIFIYNLTLAGRTLFVMLLLLLAVNLLFLIFMGEKKSKKYKTLLIVTLVVLSLVILYNANAFGVQDAFESSNLYDRFFGHMSSDLDDDGRIDRKLEYIEHFEKSLWGGIHLRPLYGHAHDIFLDSYDEAGIFALITIVAFMISVVMRLVGCATTKALKFETRQWIISMYVAILAQFMVEPVVQGLPWMLMLFCFIHGMVTRLDKISRQNAAYLIAKESQSNTTKD